MNASNTPVRLALAAAAVISTTLSLGSVFLLADHYSSTPQLATAPAVVVA